MKIIFLDIDGVLNHEKAYEKGECRFIEHGNTRYEAFSISSKKLLNELIKETGAKIVVSSTWRSKGIDWLKEVWKKERMNGEIIGITPRIMTRDGHSVPRGVEIEDWLSRNNYRHINYSAEEQYRYMMKSGIDSYVILDDDSDMLYNQRNHFVHILHDPNNKAGFNPECKNKALGILNKTILELNHGHKFLN